MSALAKFSLLALIFVGGATIHGLSVSSGYYELIEVHKAKGVLHDGTLYDPRITGVDGLDDFLGTLVQFFWPSADGSSPGSSLQSLLFTSQFVPFLMIWLLEGFRAGNKGKLVSYVTIYGLLCQAGGVALISPIYLLLYVFTSPTVASPSPSNLAINPGILSGIPVAFLLGFVAPTVFMSLPTPSILPLETKVKALALWQPFPVYVAIVLQVFKTLSGGSGSPPSNIERVKKLRNVYKFGLLLSVPLHATVWGFSLAALFFPQIFTPSIAAAFHPLASLIPANPWTYGSTSVPSMAKGALNFLQWDYYVSSTAYLVFGLAARFNSKVEPRGFSASAAAGLIARIAVLGPNGTALSYLWERDEIVLAKEEGQKKLH